MDLEQLIYDAINHISINNDTKKFVINMVIWKIRLSRKRLKYKDDFSHN